MSQASLFTDNVDEHLNPLPVSVKAMEAESLQSRLRAYANALTLS